MYCTTSACPDPVDRLLALRPDEERATGGAQGKLENEDAERALAEPAGKARTNPQERCPRETLPEAREDSLRRCGGRSPNDEAVVPNRLTRLRGVDDRELLRRRAQSADRGDVATATAVRGVDAQVTVAPDPTEVGAELDALAAHAETRAAKERDRKG